jgi:PAS domain S-box-containing protein
MFGIVPVYGSVKRPELDDGAAVTLDMTLESVGDQPLDDKDNRIRHDAFDESTDDIYETAPCALLSVSPHEVIVKVNQTFLSWTGYEREEVIGRERFGDILPRAGQMFHQSRLVPLLPLQGFVNEVALDILCKDGARLSVFVSAMQKKDAGGHLMTRFTLFSASVRRQYESALLKAQKNAMLADARLHEQEERLRITLNSLGDGVIATDIEGNITYLNPAASRMTGWSEQDAIGLPLPQVFHVVDEDNGCVAPNLAALVLNEKPVPTLDCMTLISKTGERFAIKDTATPIRDPSNRINGVVLGWLESTAISTPCNISTWINSRSSTTPAAVAPAMNCYGSCPLSCERSCAQAIPLPVSGATSSACCSLIVRETRRWRSRIRYANRSRNSILCGRTMCSRSARALGSHLRKRSCHGVRPIAHG